VATAINQERHVDSEIQVYGTSWCGLTFRVREYLMKAHLAYEFFDIERDSKAREFVWAMTDGHLRFPLVIIEHQLVTEPTVAELQRVIDAHGIRPRTRRSRKGTSLETTVEADSQHTK